MYYLINGKQYCKMIEPSKYKLCVYKIYKHFKNEIFIYFTQFDIELTDIT